MKWIRVICLLGWLAAGAQAADETRPAARRFLLIVEASSASSRCSASVETAARQLVGGAFDGKMQAGDTLGVWVYQTSVDVSFPMQVWSPSAAWPVSQGVIDHLRRRKWDESPIWENVLVALRKVAVASDDLTVAVISSPGNRLTTGGELDGRIGTTYAEAESDLRLNKLPFVTFFAVRNGKLVDAAVNSGLGPWTIPDPPVKPRPKVDPVSPAKSSMKKPVPALEEPRIFIGSNAEQVMAAVASMPAIQKSENATPIVAGSVPPRIETPPVLPTVSAPSVASPKEVAPVASLFPEPTLPVELKPAVAKAGSDMANQTAVAPPLEAAASAPKTLSTVPAPMSVATPPSPVGSVPKRSAQAVTAMVSSVDHAGVGYLFGAVGSILLAAGALWWFAGNRHRAPVPSSLITRSMDRR
jgi:hypothetical protein